MAWIRLDDDYIYHPKFVALSAGAFRLWHEGMAYCRKLLTDGLIPRAALRTFRYAKRPFVDELATSIGADVAPLWESIPEFGFKVHDYLAWNKSREEELKDRDEARARAQKSRDVRRTCAARSNKNKNGEEGSVLGEKGSGEKPVLAVLPNVPLPGFTRLRIFRWMVDDMLATLGDAAATFDLDGWLHELDANTRLVLPVTKEERWTWLQQALAYEIRQRRLVPDARDEQVRQLLKAREAR